MVMYLGRLSKRLRQTLARRLRAATGAKQSLQTITARMGFNWTSHGSIQESETNGPLLSQVAATHRKQTIGALVLKNAGFRFWKFFLLKLRYCTV